MATSAVSTMVTIPTRMILNEAKLIFLTISATVFIWKLEMKSARLCTLLTVPGNLITFA